MADLSNAVEKLKHIMSTDEGRAGIQNFISNLGGEGGGGVDLSKLGGLLGNNLGAESSADNNADNFNDFGNHDSFSPDEPTAGGNDNASPFGNIDMETMMKMGKMFSAMNSGGGNNRHANMLNSLKPYLNNDRKGKLDMASKLMTLAKFAPLMKDMM